MANDLLVSEECEFALKTDNKVVFWLLFLGFKFQPLLLQSILSDHHSIKTAVTSFSSLLIPTSDRLGVFSRK